ncbi:hypothetical protein HW115_18635 [Verrucomicrobiaceae bacterium N1E253]|uniref:Uncharacterized protein n=1 Tax=Oceaniferula marina TaxID=2748318 RepID=A0A851GP41_9BACT|nr:hypothetical protein [Oceaniferula marina]NWK57641.1 hypothetical protein [Oceaniferula marina]
MKSIIVIFLFSVTNLLSQSLKFETKDGVVLAVGTVEAKNGIRPMIKLEIINKTKSELQFKVPNKSRGFSFEAKDIEGKLVNLLPSWIKSNMPSRLGHNSTSSFNIGRNEKFIHEFNFEQAYGDEWMDIHTIVVTWDPMSTITTVVSKEGEGVYANPDAKLKISERGIILTIDNYALKSMLKNM